MDIGSGLRLQTSTKGSKPGIYFVPPPEDINSHNRNATTTTAKKKVKKGFQRGANTRTQQLQQQKREQIKQKQEEQAEKALREKKQRRQNIARISNKSREKTPPQDKNTANSSEGTNNDKKDGGNSYVTLTEGQLNTILSLVKNQNVSNIVSKDHDSGEVVIQSSSDNAGDGKPSSGVTRSKPSSGVSTRTQHSTDQAGDVSHGDNNDLNKEDGAGKPTVEALNIDAEPEENTKVYTFGGTLMGLGSREVDRERLERNRKKWVEELKEQMESKKNEKKSARENKKSHSDGSYFGGGNNHGYAGNNQNNNSNNLQQLTTNSNSPGSSAESNLQKQQQQTSAADSHLHEANENLPSAMRSSFFIGESAPRTHAFSEKKRLAQQRWRSELEQQINERKEKKRRDEEKVRRQDQIDEEGFLKHFETLARNSPTQQQQQQNTVDQPPPAIKQQQPPAQEKEIRFVPANPATTNNNNTNNNNSSAIERQSSGDDVVGGHHLRKMTSLLDPAEKEAIATRRLKQQEHMRAIAQQVEEKKRLKEEEELSRRREEEEAERRLREEREDMRRQFEMEKMSQKQKEELRDAKTRQLYEQVQKAQQSAERDRFEKRQKLLRRNGHDTSRLELTHRNKIAGGDDSHQVNSHQVNSHRLPFDGESTSAITVQPSLQAVDHGLPPQPKPPAHRQVIHLNKGHVTDLNEPIRLEISLSNSQGSLHDTKEISVQTDALPSTTSVDHYTGNDSLISETPTEYIPLPILSSRGSNTKSMRVKDGQPETDGKKKKTTIDKKKDTIYDRYARTRKDKIAKLESRIESKEAKPRWGGGNGGKKEYKSASDRYIDDGQRLRREENKRRRKEQLLMQQQSNMTAIAYKSSGKQKGKPQPPNQAAGKRQADKQLENDTRMEQTESKPKLEVRSRDQRSNEIELAPERRWDHVIDFDQRPISVTTHEAKWNETKHSRSSPVPDTLNDFVEYRRSEVILKPDLITPRIDEERPISTNAVRKSGGDLLTARREEGGKSGGEDRQDRILKEISILRHGLLLKQREVASSLPYHTHKLDNQ